MTLNLTESNKNSNYYLTQIDDIRNLNVTTQEQVDDIQTDVDTLQTDMSTAQGQISALITAGTSGESQIELDAVIAEVDGNTTDISNMKVDITDLQAKTDFIETVTSSTTTQSERTTYLNDQGDTIGFIGPDGDNLYIGCSVSKNLILNPDQGSVTHLCENNYFGDENGPGRLILNNNGDDSGSITIDGEIQNHAFTDVDHTLLNGVTSEISSLQTQINTTNNAVTTVSNANIATQAQLDTVVADLDTAELFISGHTDDIADLSALINTNKNNIESNDDDIAGLVSDIAAVNVRVDNVGTGASNQTQVDAIQLSTDANRDDIADLVIDVGNNASLAASNASLAATNSGRIDDNNTDIASIKTKTDVISEVGTTQTSQTLRTRYLDPNDPSISVGRIGSHTAGTQLNIEAFNNKPLVLYSDNYIDHWCGDNYFGKTSDPGKLIIRGDGGSIFMNGESQYNAFTNADHDLIATNASNIADIEADINTIKTNVETNRVDIVDNKNEITDNQMQITILGGRVTNNDTDITNINTDITTLQTQMNTANTNITAVEADNTATQSQVDIITTDLATAETDIVNLQADVTDIQTNVNALGSDDTKQTNYISTIVPHPTNATYSDH